MDLIIAMRFFDDGSSPHKELKVYDKAGNALGYGTDKLTDIIEKSSDRPLDLFSQDQEQVDARVVTFFVALNEDKLKQLLKE